MNELFFYVNSSEDFFKLQLLVCKEILLDDTENIIFDIYCNMNFYYIIIHGLRAIAFI